ncbi:MAG TPA: hypothetical protein VFW63_08845 [Acidimicrobiales bacterium]|nr:hypothetical protein [Acidimicrobiales bacterium]
MTVTSQLTLIDTPRSWKLDDRTREVGRQGVARARAALRAGRRQGPAEAARDTRAPARARAVRPPTRRAA